MEFHKTKSGVRIGNDFNKHKKRLGLVGFSYGYWVWVKLSGFGLGSGLENY